MENANQMQYGPVSSHRARSVVVTTPTGKNPSIVKWLLLGFLIVAMLLMGFLTILMIGGMNTGLVGLIVGMITAILPVPIYLALVIWIDRFEPEPWWLLALTFMWGATGAVFFSFILNTAGTKAVAMVLGPEVAAVYGPSISAPIVEESFKAMALFGVFFFRRREFDGVLDGIVYAAMVGLGFAMTENFSYYGAYGPGIFAFRGTLLAYAHPIFTSMTGIGLGIAAENRNIIIKIIAPLVGFMSAISLHAFNNSIGRILGALFGEAGAVLGFFTVLLVIPTLGICIVILMLIALAREGFLMNKYLQEDVTAGRLTQQEVKSVILPWLRVYYLFMALTGGGPKALIARSRFAHIACELALFRRQLDKGIYLRDAFSIAQENEYAKALAELRAQLPTG